MIVVEEIWSAYCDGADCCESAELDADEEQSQQKMIAALEDLSWAVVPNQDGRLPCVFCPEHAKERRDDVAREVVERLQSPEGRAESQEAIRQAIHRGRQAGSNDFCCIVPNCAARVELTVAEIAADTRGWSFEPDPCGGWLTRCPEDVRESDRAFVRGSKAYELIDHPQHYGGADDPYEVIKVVEAWRLGFCTGNAVKYIARAGKKPGEDELRDLKKARWYIDRAIKRLEEK